MIEQNTTSAAMSKIRSPSAMPSPSTSSENVIVATPLGPNHAMNAFVGGRAGAGQRDRQRDRPGDQERDDDDRHRRPAVAEQALEREQRAEHDEDRRA